MLAYLGNKTEGQLKTAYDNTDDRSERRKITREMESRGKERSIISGWQDIAVEEEYSSNPFNYDNGPKFLNMLQGIAPILNVANLCNICNCLVCLPTYSVSIRPLFPTCRTILSS